MWIHDNLFVSVYDRIGIGNYLEVCGSNHALLKKIIHISCLYYFYWVLGTHVSAALSTRCHPVSYTHLLKQHSTRHFRSDWIAGSSYTILPYGMPLWYVRVLYIFFLHLSQDFCWVGNKRISWCIPLYNFSFYPFVP